MKPALSEKERAVLTLLGNKNPEQCDPFDNHIRGEIGRLSMAIGKRNSELTELKVTVEEVEQDLVRNIGAYQATARTYLAYIESSMIRPVDPSTAPPTHESPQDARSEATSESGTPAPADPETSSEEPNQGQEDADKPVAEPGPEPDSKTEPEKG